VVRAAAVLAVLTALAVYYAVSESLPDLSTWGDVAFIGLVLIPTVFSLTWLALPLWQEAGRGLLAAAILVLVALAAAFWALGFDVAANFAKFAAVSTIGWSRWRRASRRCR
jgi:hypothetical protein